MGKKLICVIAILVMLTACGGKGESIEGYWMAENGDTISFNSNGNAIIDGMTCEYSIYDKNNLSISFLGFAEEYRFEVNSNTLLLTDLSTGTQQKFYKDEKKQKEIIEKLNQIAQEQAEEERVQQEIDQQRKQEEKEQQDYERYVLSLKNNVQSIDSEIETYKALIEYTQDMIDDYEEDIAFFQSEPEIYDNEFIESFRDEQDEMRADIADYREAISNLEREKKDVIAELKSLGEY